MEGSETHEQDGMLDLELLEALSEQLNNAIVPTNTPPEELVQSASGVGHAWGRWSFQSDYSPRERTSAR
eukprot:6607350-Prorocentrum_lima.AAC.1